MRKSVLLVLLFFVLLGGAVRAHIDPGEYTCTYFPIIGTDDTGYSYPLSVTHEDPILDPPCYWTPTPEPTLEPTVTPTPEGCPIPECDDIGDECEDRGCEWDPVCEIWINCDW